MAIERSATEPRKALHAYLSDEAHDAWHDFAAEHGISVSGMLEAMSESLNLIGTDWVIKRARAVDTERRRRNRRR